MVYGCQGWDDPSVVPDKSTYEDWNGVRGLGLVGNAAFFPHMDDQWQPLVADKISSSKDDECTGERSYYCLRDEEACCVIGNSKSITVLSTSDCLEPALVNA